MNTPRAKLFSWLNLHFLGVGVLVLLNLVLGVRLLAAWHTLHDSGEDQIVHAQAQYRTLDLELRPLRGLPDKVGATREEAAKFYSQRFPAAYSTISAAIGDLASKNNVHLTRVSYIQQPSIPDLTEVHMDASLSGEYAPLMHFINGLERSRTFFLIDGLTLTGQQGGLVNLRLRLTTYLHAGTSDQIAPPVNRAQNVHEENR